MAKEKKSSFRKGWLKMCGYSLILPIIYALIDAVFIHFFTDIFGGGSVISSLLWTVLIAWSIQLLVIIAAFAVLRDSLWWSRGYAPQANELQPDSE